MTAIFVVISGCRHDRPVPDAGAPAIDAPFAGCAAVVRVEGRTVCELGDARTVRVVLRGGTRSIDVAKDATEVNVEGFRLAIAHQKKLPWLEEAKALRAKGQAAEARAIAEPHAKDEDPVSRAYAEGLLARLDLASGKTVDSIPHFQAAIASHRSSGRVSDSVDDSFALAFALHQRSQRYVEARKALDAIGGELAFYPEGRARDPYYRGILAGETGDHRGALAQLADATKRATELGMTKLARNARSSTALEMQELGRAKDAQKLLVALDKELADAPDATPCERAEIANNLGWGALLLDEDARPALERAISVEGCSDAFVRSFALGNLARVALRTRNADLAEKRLAEARAAVSEPRGVERIENRILEGRIALARENPARALAMFDEALGFARAAILKLPEWNALTARAEAQIALGKKDDAVRSLLDAERVLDEAALLVPLGEGRASFVSDRSRSARAAVGLLARLGRPLDAARVARRSRARVLAGVERALRLASLTPDERGRWEQAVRSFRAERATLDAAAAGDWKLAADDLKRATEKRRDQETALRSSLEKAMGILSKTPAESNEDPPLGPTDLEIVVHPDSTGWIAIARSTDDAIAYSLAPPVGSPEDQAQALLAPIATRIQGATRLHVRAYGAWRGVDIHALPFHGAPLVAALVVDYPLGLDRPPTPNRGTGRTVVVGDPRGDLPSAREEANKVFLSYPAEGVTLLARDDATAEKVATELRRSTTFHYAGHGIFAGVEGWESALPLAGGGKLDVADVLALAPVPARVVLSGCDAARSEGDAEGLGLAQAFIAAGADEVVAPVRPVADALAAKIAVRLHAKRDPFAITLRDATSVLRTEDPAADWAAFRVVTR